MTFKSVLSDMPSLFEPTSSGFRRHVRAVRVTAAVLLVAAIGTAGYATFSAGRAAYRLVAPEPESKDK
jgi:hypothetical protein